MLPWLSHLLLPTETPDVTQSLITIMLAIGIGVFIGRLKLGKISLGVAAVMFVGLVLGHYGYRIQIDILDFIRNLGLILFVYGIGMQVGPSFFSSFRKEGLRFNLLAVGTVLLGGVVTYVLFLTSGMNIENLVGVMTGAVTNTPGLGAAKTTLEEVQRQFPDKVFADPAIAYAITYPIGVMGIIVTIILSKMWLKVDPAQELLKYKSGQSQQDEPLVHKKCRVTNTKYFAMTIQEAKEESGHPDLMITRLKHSGNKAAFLPTPDTRFRENDVLMVVGYEKEVDDFISKAGRISTDLFIESEQDVQVKNIFVTRPDARHKTLGELDLYNKYDLKVTRLFRAGKEMMASPTLELFYGDKLRVVGTKESIEEVEKIVGNSEKQLLEPDFLSLFGGLLLGVILGSIPIMIPSLPVPVKLGFAAGPLIVALFVSRFGGIGVIHSYINNGANYFMKDLGICLFFAAVGVQAGQHFYDNFIAYNGWLMMLYGMCITFIPMIIMVLIGTLFMKLNFLQLAGLMSGTYTDPAALAFSTSYLDSDIPVQSYAMVYPLVTIMRIFVAQMLVLMFAG